MFRTRYILADMVCEGLHVKAEFDGLTGRLRILSGREVWAEWFPPHSWFAIASVAGGTGWGTSPSEADLRLVISDFASRQYQEPRGDSWRPTAE
jgi:hypothetical protein